MLLIEICLVIIAISLVFLTRRFWAGLVAGIFIVIVWIAIIAIPLGWLTWTFWLSDQAALNRQLILPTCEALIAMGGFVMTLRALGNGFRRGLNWRLRALCWSPAPIAFVLIRKFFLDESMHAAAASLVVLGGLAYAAVLAVKRAVAQLKQREAAATEREQIRREARLFGLPEDLDAETLRSTPEYRSELRNQYLDYWVNLPEDRKTGGLADRMIKEINEELSALRLRLGVSDSMYESMSSFDRGDWDRKWLRYEIFRRPETIKARAQEALQEAEKAVETERARDAQLNDV